MDPRVPAWLGGGDPMDGDRPLFSTFKPIIEDNVASARTGPDTSPVQPQGAEQPPGHRDTHSRVPPVLSPPEGDPRPELAALRARTRLWFEQTQAGRLGAEGELPAWFHGFISRRETEQLLQDQPPGCFLVRFSESTVGFVLSYRGRDRCRHFVLDQLPDGRYVILGERSAHAELAELLRHYSTAPVTPYHEFLTVPCVRDEPRGGMWFPTGSAATCSPSSEVPAKLPAYGTMSRGPPGARPAATDLPLPMEPGARGATAREVTAPRVPPPLPAKVASSAAAPGLCSPQGPCAPVHRGAAPPEPPQPPDAKYQQLLCFHTYAEPHEGIAPRPEEPIPFYAMGQGRSPHTHPQENVYSEVALARQDCPAPLPRVAQGAFSTLPPKCHMPPRPAHRRLLRSMSSQVCRRRQLPAAPGAGGKDRGDPGAATKVAMTNPALEFDDPIYSRRTRVTKRDTTRAGQDGPQNIYEQLSGERL
ncbi:SH2 domain-containing protein 2A [Caloenas nicobarica]|uniref:SH2 domain-containing protein 2A n=1 Tax=Caloenas nicobarica TaxID=187106 RepID=UPI0032B78A59